MCHRPVIWLLLLQMLTGGVSSSVTSVNSSFSSSQSSHSHAVQPTPSPQSRDAAVKTSSSPASPDTELRQRKTNTARSARWYVICRWFNFTCQKLPNFYYYPNVCQVILAMPCNDIISMNTSWWNIFMFFFLGIMPITQQRFLLYLRSL